MRLRSTLGRGLATMLLVLPMVVHADDLMQVYQLAQDSDPQLKAAEAGWRAAQEAKPQARALLLPQIGLGVSTSHNWYNPHGGSSGSTQYTNKGWNVSLTQPIFHMDSLVQQGQAEASVAKADADLAAARQDLFVRVAQAYFDVLRAKDQLEYARSDKNAIGRQLEQAKKRFEVGLIAVTDVHTAQAQYDLAKAQEIAAQDGLTTAREALAEITGKGIPSLAPLGEKVPLVPPTPAKIDSWAQSAQADNLNLQSERQSVSVARQEVERNRAGHYPTLDLVASHNYSDSSKQVGTGASESDSNMVGLQLNMSLFSGGAVTSRTRQALELYNQSRDQLEQQTRAILRQTRDSYRGVESSISRVNALQAALVSTKSALDATEAGFDVGTRTIVDVLNAQRDMFGAVRDYAGARYDYILNMLKLKQAAGRLNQADLEQVNGWLKH